MTPAEDIAAELTAMFRTPTGAMALRPLQGHALLAASAAGGLFTNASVGLGKAQPNSEPVLTPGGWVPIGSLRPGDLVIGSAGESVRVLSVHPQGLRDIVRVTFTDGSWTRCDAEHLWTFRRPKVAPYSDAIWCSPKRTGPQQDMLGSKWETRTLREWLDEVGLDRPCGEQRAHNLFLPMVRPIQRLAKDLPLDPYTLGALLGDGGMTQNTVNFTSMDPDIVQALQLPEGVALRKCASQSCGLATQYNLTTGRRGRRGNPLVQILKDLRLHGCSSRSKFIPEQYMQGSVEQRLELLQGLLDTDGATANPAGMVEYSTLSSRLAMDVTELVEGLGGTAHHGADAKNGNARIQIKLPRNLPPFRCRRKGEPYAKQDRQREPYRALESVTDAGQEDCTCIAVDAWDSLYVTRNHILTHNTLLIALGMSIIGGSRPLVFTEASNIKQMSADLATYRLHWQIPTNYRLESYEALGPESGAKIIEDYKPTALFLDESHKVKAVKESARARRVDRWRQANPDVPVMALSGSPGDELATYAHMLIWAVPALADTRGGPIPVDADGRPAGPAFREFCKRLEEDSSFHERIWGQIKATPGVVISAETYVEKPLHIKHTILPTPPEMVVHWQRLREFGRAPDDWVLDNGVGEQWQLARCFSNGMYYEHDPRPPKPYQEARKAWFGMCNDLIQDERAPGGPWDTPGQIAKAIVAGKLGAGGARRVYEEWMAIRPTYNPITKTTWLSEATLEWASGWGTVAAARAERSRGGAIIWTEQVGVGEALARRTGWPYFGSGARDARSGRHISALCSPTSGKIDPVIICSVKSCGTGKNLQHRYNQALFMSPPSNNDACEQWFGRIHRSMQPMPDAHVELLYGCLEDWTGEQKAENEARQAEIDLEAPRKLLLATHQRTAFPRNGGPAWEKVGRVEVIIPR